jgi:hypothetical protein
MNYGGTVWENRFVKTPIGDLEGSLEFFIGELQEMSELIYARKEDAPLIQASFANEARGQDHVRYSTGLWLDHDGNNGKTLPTKLARLLKCRFVAFNSYSFSPERLKYRIYIPVDRQMTADEYRIVWKFVMDELQAPGFDPAPSNAASIFYVPCVAGSGLGFFEDHKDAPLLKVEPILERMDRIQRKIAEQEAKRAALCPPRKSMSEEEVEQLLEKLSSDDRHLWFRVGCALHHEFGEEGKVLWRRWSSHSPKYDARDQEKTWKSISTSRSRKPITIGTLIYIAKNPRAA